MVFFTAVSAFAVMVAGLFLLSLAMNSHRRQLGLAGELSPVRQWLLRAMGFGCIGAAAGLFVEFNGTAGFGLVTGMLAAGVGIMVVALVFAWRP
ncbi:MAG: DUF3325 family protein [Porticoccaceae bacterium]|jgi:hypothetical protein